MKKVLVVTYSQSGQLNQIVSSLTSQFPEEIIITHQKLNPIPNFNFPWQGTSFYDAMPESVKMIPSKNEPLSFDPNQKYDLIIIGYPIWFLSPPIPITTFLLSSEAKKVMNNTPIVTVIGARNMWVMAQEDIKKMITQNGGNLVGNIALHDRHNNFISVITIIYWMGTGKKDKYLGVFPKPGISDSDISNTKRFAAPISTSILTNNYNELQNKLLELGAVDLSANVVSTEQKGKKIFQIWSSFILKKGGVGSPKRVRRLIMFKYYLLFVIFAVSPIVSLLFYLTYPLFFMRIRKKLKYYRGVSYNI